MKDDGIIAVVFHLIVSTLMEREITVNGFSRLDNRFIVAMFKT
jgi:hypothetical protein